MHITQPERLGLTETPREDKASALRRQHALNPRPQSVGDSEGLTGLVPQRPGPKRAHKLSEEIVDRLEEALKADPSLNSAQLAQRLEEDHGLRVHRRSVERALSRRLKRGAQRRP